MSACRKWGQISLLVGLGWCVLWYLSVPDVPPSHEGSAKSIWFSNWVPLIVPGLFFTGAGGILLVLASAFAYVLGSA